MRFKIFFVAVLALNFAVLAVPSLESGWENPPLNTRLRAYWWWLNGNVTKTSITRERPAPPKGPVTLKLAGLKSGNYNLVVHGTGYKRNDAYTQYLERGAPDQLTRRQQNELANLAANAPLLQETVTVSKDGNFSRTFDLHENDVCFVIFTINRSDRPPSTLNNL